MPPVSSLGRPSQAPFKPPRPLGSTAQPNRSLGLGTTVDKQANRASTVGDAASTNMTAHEDTLSESGESQHRANLSDSDGSDGNAVTSAAPSTSPRNASSVPTKLLSFLLHDNFQHDDTRITKDAMALLDKYVDTFVKEAIARAVCEIEELDNKRDDGFLEVEDLEKLAPQLLLDF